MTHYICTGGCGTVSDASASCSDLACPMYGLELTECGCDDGQHGKSPSLSEDNDWEDGDISPAVLNEEVGELEERFKDAEEETY